MNDQLSKNFYRYEFKCKCGKCDYDQADIELVNVLQDIRNYFAVPIVITSGNRCPEHNVKVKGSEKSMHMKGGQAVDFYATGISPKKMFAYLDHKYRDKYGLGDGKSFTHLDIRSYPVRWAY